MPKTFVSSVILKIFRICSWVQTRSSEPSGGRTRFRPPASTPRPAEPGNPGLVQVDDGPAAGLGGQVGEQLTRPRRGAGTSLALDGDDLDAVLAVVTWPQLRTSSSRHARWHRRCRNAPSRAGWAGVAGVGG